MRLAAALKLRQQRKKDWIPDFWAVWVKLKDKAEKAGTLSALESEMNPS